VIQLDCVDWWRALWTAWRRVVEFFLGDLDVFELPGDGGGGVEVGVVLGKEETLALGEAQVRAWRLDGVDEAGNGRGPEEAGR